MLRFDELDYNNIFLQMKPVKQNLSQTFGFFWCFGSSSEASGSSSDVNSPNILCGVIFISSHVEHAIKFRGCCHGQNSSFMIRQNSLRLLKGGSVLSRMVSPPWALNAKLNLADCIYIWKESEITSPQRWIFSVATKYWGRLSHCSHRRSEERRVGKECA